MLGDIGMDVSVATLSSLGRTPSEDDVADEVKASGSK